MISLILTSTLWGSNIALSKGCIYIPHCYLHFRDEASEDDQLFRMHVVTGGPAMLISPCVLLTTCLGPTCNLGMVFLSQRHQRDTLFIRRIQLSGLQNGTSVLFLERLGHVLYFRCFSVRSDRVTDKFISSWSSMPRIFCYYYSWVTFSCWMHIFAWLHVSQ